MSEPDQPETPPPPPPPPSYGACGRLPPCGRAVAVHRIRTATERLSNGLGIASLVTAIIALLTVVGGIVLGPVAVILGFLGWGKAKRGEANNGGIAVAGIVLGFLSIIEAIVVIGLLIWGLDGGTDLVDCLSRAGTDEQAQQQCAEQFTEHMEDQFSMTITTPTP